MSSRTFLCAGCGKLRRRLEAWALVQGEPGWPMCCGLEMALLHHVQAAGVAKYSPAERLLWLALGSGLVQRRKRGSRKWSLALTPKQAAIAAGQLDRFQTLRAGPAPAPQEKVWKAARRRASHAKKKRDS